VKAKKFYLLLHVVRATTVWLFMFKYSTMFILYYILLVKCIISIFITLCAFKLMEFSL